MLRSQQRQLDQTATELLADDWFAALVALFTDQPQSRLRAGRSAVRGRRGLSRLTLTVLTVLVAAAIQVFWVVADMTGDPAFLTATMLIVPAFLARRLTPVVDNGYSLATIMAEWDRCPAPRSGGRSTPAGSGWTVAATTAKRSTPLHRQRHPTPHPSRGDHQCSWQDDQVSRADLPPLSRPQGSTSESAVRAAWRSDHAATARTVRRTRLPRCQALTSLRRSVALTGFPLCSSRRLTVLTR